MSADVIRRNADGTLDEVCADHPKFVHLEQMSASAWWLRIDLANGGAIIVDLTARSRIGAKVEEE